MSQRHTPSQHEEQQQQQYTESYYTQVPSFGSDSTTGAPFAVQLLPPASSSSAAETAGQYPSASAWQTTGQYAGQQQQQQQQRQQIRQPSPSASTLPDAQSLHSLRLSLADLERRADSLAQPAVIQAAVDKYLEQHLADTIKRVIAEMMTDDDTTYTGQQQQQRFVASVPPPAATVAVPPATGMLSAADAAAAAAATAALNAASAAFAAAQQEVTEISAELHQGESKLQDLVSDGSLASSEARASKLASLKDMGKKANMAQRDLCTVLDFLLEKEQELAQAQQSLELAQQQLQHAQGEVQRFTSGGGTNVSGGGGGTHWVPLAAPVAVAAAAQPVQSLQGLSPEMLASLIANNPAVQAAIQQALATSLPSQAAAVQQLLATSAPPAAAGVSGPVAMTDTTTTMAPSSQPQVFKHEVAAPVPFKAEPVFQQHAAAAAAAAGPVKREGFEQPPQQYPSPSPYALPPSPLPPSAVAPRGPLHAPQTFAEAVALEGGRSAIPPELLFLLQCGFRAFDFTFRTSAVNHIKSLLRDKLRMSASGLAQDVWHFEARYNASGIQEWRSWVQFHLPPGILANINPPSSSAAPAAAASQQAHDFRAPPSSWYLVKTQSTEESAVLALRHMRKDTQLKNLFLRPVPPLNDPNPISAMRNAVRDRSVWKSTTGGNGTGGVALTLDERIVLPTGSALYHAQLFYGDQCIGEGSGGEKVLAKTEASVDALFRWNRAIEFIREKTFTQLVRIQWLELNAE